jgi:hypothetical protein
MDILGRGGPLGYRIDADHSVVLRTRFVDTSQPSGNGVAGGVGNALVLRDVSQSSSTINIYKTISTTSTTSSSTASATGADENATHVPAHVTVCAVSKKDNRARLLSKIDELSKRIERLRGAARANDQRLTLKAKAYKAALREAREANRAMELHVREQLREQATQHLQQRRDAVGGCSVSKVAGEDIGPAWRALVWLSFCRCMAGNAGSGAR